MVETMDEKMRDATRELSMTAMRAGMEIMRDYSAAALLGASTACLDADRATLLGEIADVVAGMRAPLDENRESCFARRQNLVYSAR